MTSLRFNLKSKSSVEFDSECYDSWHHSYASYFVWCFTFQREKIHRESKRVGKYVWHTFHSRPTNTISYKSWYIQLKFGTLLRLLRLKLQPREAAEVARFQAKKNCSKILKSAIFELHKHYIPQKKAENNCHSDLK